MPHLNWQTTPAVSVHLPHPAHGADHGSRQPVRSEAGTGRTTGTGPCAGPAPAPAVTEWPRARCVWTDAPSAGRHASRLVRQGGDRGTLPMPVPGGGRRWTGAGRTQRRHLPADRAVPPVAAPPPRRGACRSPASGAPVAVPGVSAGAPCRLADRRVPLTAPYRGRRRHRHGAGRAGGRPRVPGAVAGVSAPASAPGAGGAGRPGAGAGFSVPVCDAGRSAVIHAGAPVRCLPCRAARRECRLRSSPPLSRLPDGAPALPTGMPVCAASDRAGGAGECRCRHAGATPTTGRRRQCRQRSPADQRHGSAGHGGGLGRHPRRAGRRRRTPRSSAPVVRVPDAGRRAAGAGASAGPRCRSTVPVHRAGPPCRSMARVRRWVPCADRGSRLLRHLSRGQAGTPLRRDRGGPGLPDVQRPRLVGYGGGAPSGRSRSGCPRRPADRLGVVPSQ